MFTSLLMAVLAAPLPARPPVDVAFTPGGPPISGLKLHVEIDGKPLELAFNAARREYMNALFAHLDRDRNGTLSEQEAARAPKLLFMLPDVMASDVHVAQNFRAMDPNGDGKITREELDSYYMIFEDSAFGLPAPLTAPADFRLGVRLFEALDTDRDGKLSKLEIANAVAALERADRDGDELLTPEDLIPGFGMGPRTTPTSINARRVLEVPKDKILELRLKLGQRAQGVQPLEVVQPVGKVLVQKNDLIVLNVNDCLVEMRCDLSWLSEKTVTRLGDDYRRTIRLADKEYLEKILPLQVRSMAARASMLVSARGDGLWDLLDRNRDGILGVREARDAPRLLGLIAQFDKDGDGFISPEEVPTSFVVQFGPGRTHFARLSGQDVVTLRDGGQLDYPGAEVGSGPLWFRKMDRNGDGDVSRKEFLGAPSHFKKLDLDGDGWISREEAEAAEAKNK